MKQRCFAEDLYVHGCLNLIFANMARLLRLASELQASLLWLSMQQSMIHYISEPCAIGERLYGFLQTFL